MMTCVTSMPLYAQPSQRQLAIGMLLWRLCHPRDVSLPLKWPSLDQAVMVEHDFYTRFFHDKKWLGGLSADGPQRRVLVLGQPGIGKTAFGWWLVA